MDEHSSNIDIVFRNGLRNLEVLPPAEAWENIRQSAAVSARPRPGRLLRSAAMIAVAMSLSFLAYLWSVRMTEKLPGSAVAFNIEAPLPIHPGPVTSITESGNEAVKPARVMAVSPGNSPSLLTAPGDDAYNDPQTPALPGDEIAGETVNESLRNLKNLTLGASSFQPYFSEPDNSDIFGNNQKQERWSLGAVASPTLYARIGGNEDPAVQQMKSSEQAQISYTGGIAFYYKLSKRFSIQSGVYYSSVGQEVNGINAFSGFQQYDMTKGSRNFEVLTTNGKVYTNNADVFLLAEGGGDRVLTSYTIDQFDPVKANLQYLNNSLQQNFSFVELPILIRYKFVDRTIDLNLVGGISYNMLVGNNVFTYIGGDKYNIGKTEGLSPITFSSSIGMGMEYSFSPSFSMNLEPTFRYYLDPFNPLEGSRMHPYSFGLFSGLRYKF